MMSSAVSPPLPETHLDTTTTKAVNHEIIPARGEARSFFLRATAHPTTPDNTNPWNSASSVSHVRSKRCSLLASASAILAAPPFSPCRISVLASFRHKSGFVNGAIAGHQRVIFLNLWVGRGPANVALGRLQRDHKIDRRFDHRPIGGGVIQVAMQAIMMPNRGGDIGDEIGVAD